MAKATFADYKRFVRGINLFLGAIKCDCIQGFGLGVKITNGKPTKNLSVNVFVSKKMSLRRLPLANRIPETVRIPSASAPGGVYEFTTDVLEGKFSSVEFTQRMRPVPSGISIAHADVTAGTLGGLFRDAETGKVVILSNNHVLAASNNGAPGDPILQPGPADGGVLPDDEIGLLERFVPIDFTEGVENRVDAAIAAPHNPADLLWATQGIGPETPREIRRLGDADLGTFVHKSGRTTEHTQGFIQAMFATVKVKYDLFQKATFVDQIIISQSPGEESFSNGGDSGSLIYDSNNKCVGLLFAGSEGTETEPATTIANPIGEVMRALNLKLLATGEHPSA